MKLATGIVAVLLAVIAAGVLLHLRAPRHPYVPAWVYDWEAEVTAGRKAHPDIHRVPRNLEELRYRVS
jgi:hypothetical protein